MISRTLCRKSVVIITSVHGDCSQQVLRMLKSFIKSNHVPPICCRWRCTLKQQSFAYCWWIIRLLVQYLSTFHRRHCLIGILVVRKSPFALSFRGTRCGDQSITALPSAVELLRYDFSSCAQPLLYPMLPMTANSSIDFQCRSAVTPAVPVELKARHLTDMLENFCWYYRRFRSVTSHHNAKAELKGSVQSSTLVR